MTNWQVYSEIVKVVTHKKPNVKAQQVITHKNRGKLVDIESS